MPPTWRVTPTACSASMKLMIRSQNYPDLETVEEEEARIVAATADEATGAEAEEIERKATVTNDQLDEMLTNDLNTVGYTREYFVQNQTASVQREKIREYAAEGCRSDRRSGEGRV